MHVIQRGNNRSPIFFGDDDRCRYLDFVVAASDKHDCPVHSYVLMGNHEHLLMTPAHEHSLAKTMKLLNNRYGWHFNKLHERTGGLWEGRCTAKHVATDRYLRICYQYIELNPVRAGICRRARDYIDENLACGPRWAPRTSGSGRIAGQSAFIRVSPG